jgi:uncharacterized protein with HEPN domain
MNREEKKYLWDIVKHIDQLLSFIEQIKTIDEFRNNHLVQSAVEREFEIIGVACKNLLDINPEIQITYSKKIIGMRNIIAHGYDEVDEKIVWKTIHDFLPTLRNEASKLLDTV